MSANDGLSQWAEIIRTARGAAGKVAGSVRSDCASPAIIGVISSSHGHGSPPWEMNQVGRRAGEGMPSV